MATSSVVRRDAWKEQEDKLLLDTVIRHVENGSTQLNAFEEAGAKIGRSAVACGYRWNSYLRKSNEDLLQGAKERNWERERALREKAKKEYQENRRKAVEFTLNKEVRRDLALFAQFTGRKQEEIIEAAITQYIEGAKKL